MKAGAKAGGAEAPLPVLLPLPVLPEPLSGGGAVGVAADCVGVAAGCGGDPGGGDPGVDRLKPTHKLSKQTPSRWNRLSSFHFWFSFWSP